jgi:hypothetical protein
MAISTKGVTLKYGSTTPTTEVLIKDFPQVLGSRSALETTTLSDDAQTFIPGIRQQSETLDFTANFDASIMSAINALTAVQKCELAFSDGSKYTWDGYVSAAINEGSVDAVVEMTVSITPTSVPTFTAGAGA